MRVLAISGSLRRGSHNTQLLRAAQELAPDDVEIELYDELEQVAPFNEDREADPPESVERLRELIDEADALLVATPEYNSSIPGQLKNAIDWASRPYGPGSAIWGKPVAVVGASTGAYGAIWAQAEARKTLGASGARVVEGDVALGHAHERFDEAGRLVDEEMRDQLGELLRDLAAAATPVAA